MEQEQQTKTTSAGSASDKAKNGCCHKHWPAILFAVLITAVLAVGGTYLLLMQKMVKDRAAVAISVRSEAQNEIAQAQSQVEALQEKIDEMKKEERENEEEKRHYKSFNLGVEFDYTRGNAYEDENKLGVLGGVGEITVFDKSSDETIEGAIKRLIIKEGKNPDDCKVVQGNTDGCSGDKCWHIALVNPYVPTKEEIGENIEENTFEYGFRTRGIRDAKIEELCSFFAPGPGPGAGFFIYDQENLKTKFIYLYSHGLDPLSFDVDSIRFVKDEK